MSVSIAKLSYETLDGLSREHAEWLYRYVGENENSKIVIHEDFLEEAIKSARADEKSHKKGHRLAGNGMEYTVDHETTDQIVKLLRPLVKKEGCVDLEANW